MRTAVAQWQVSDSKQDRRDGLLIHKGLSLACRGRQTVRWHDHLFHTSTLRAHAAARRCGGVSLSRDYLGLDSTHQVNEGLRRR